MNSRRGTRTSASSSEKTLALTRFERRIDALMSEMNSKTT